MLLQGTPSDAPDSQAAKDTVERVGDVMHLCRGWPSALARQPEPETLVGTWLPTT